MDAVVSINGGEVALKGGNVTGNNKYTDNVSGVRLNN